VSFYLGEYGEVERRCGRLFGRRLRTWELAGLTGAPDDALVEVGILPGALYLEWYELRTLAFHAVQLVRRAGPDLVLVNDAFHIRRRSLQGAGLGLRVLQRQLQYARTLGIERIEVVAGRRPGENGYYSWPRYGFAGPLAPEVRRRLPPGLDHARDVLELMDSAAGRAWWRQHGTTIRVAFDVREESRSWRVFQSYLCERSQHRLANSQRRPNRP